MNVHVNAKRVRCVKNDKNVFQLACGCLGNSACALGLPGCRNHQHHHQHSSIANDINKDLSYRYTTDISCADTYCVHTPNCCLFLFPSPHTLLLLPLEQLEACHAAYEQCRQNPHRLLHCQLICLPSVNSHLKNKTEKDCKRGGGGKRKCRSGAKGGVGRRACLRCCNYANSPYTVKRLANKDFS